MKTTKVGVIGVGYVGLPLALTMVEQGDLNVVGFDTNHQRVAALNAGRSELVHVDDARLSSNKLLFTSDPELLRDCSTYVICVPTPLDHAGLPDLTAVRAAAQTVVSVVKTGDLVCLESTTYPGTTRDVLTPLLAAGGLNVGTDVFVCFSSEREDPGRQNFNVKTTPKVVGGLTLACGEVGREFYEMFVDSVVLVKTAEVAELSKLFENTHRAVNIALANELKDCADALKVDFYAAMDAAATKPFGFTPYYPGPGVGGHCIPIDPVYLTWKVHIAGYKTPLIDAALRINDEAHGRAIQVLGEQIWANVWTGIKILLVGAAYKKGVSDVRESPFFKIAGACRSLDATVKYFDPLVPALEMFGRIEYSVGEVLPGEYDCAVIVTDQPGINYKKLLESVKFVVDCRRTYPDGTEGVIRA